MVGLHSVVGILVIAVNAAAAAVGLYFLWRKRSPRRGYLHLLAFAQTSVIAQAAIGLLMLSGGSRSVDRLHYVYGGVALAAILSPWLYAPPAPARRLLWFTGAALAAAALSVRAYLTG